MSELLPFRYWLTPDDEPATVGAAVIAVALAGAMSWTTMAKGAGRDRALVKVRGSVTAPAGCLDYDSDEWAAAEQTAPWIAHTQTPAWTESEKGVLVPEPEGTAALVQAAAATWSVEGGWEVCERLVLASETTIGGNVYAAGTHRLVRYTGTKPAALSAYPYLTAAEVAVVKALADAQEG